MKSVLGVLVAQSMLLGLGGCAVGVEALPPSPENVMNAGIDAAEACSNATLLVKEFRFAQGRNEQAIELGDLALFDATNESLMAILLDIAGIAPEDVDLKTAMVEFVEAQKGVEIQFARAMEARFAGESTDELEAELASKVEDSVSAAFELQRTCDALAPGTLLGLID